MFGEVCVCAREFDIYIYIRLRNKYLRLFVSVNRGYPRAYVLCNWLLLKTPSKSLVRVDSRGKLMRLSYVQFVFIHF